MELPVQGVPNFPISPPRTTSVTEESCTCSSRWVGWNPGRLPGRGGTWDCICRRVSGQLGNSPLGRGHIASCMCKGPKGGTSQWVGEAERRPRGLGRAAKERVGEGGPQVRHGGQLGLDHPKPEATWVSFS